MLTTVAQIKKIIGTYKIWDILNDIIFFILTCMNVFPIFVKRLDKDWISAI